MSFALRRAYPLALILVLGAVLPATGEEITVTLDYDEPLGVLRVEVTDTGTGIPKEDKDHLFEPYFSTKKSGTGLGLAIVNRIINDHNGFIRVEDNKPKGTRFIVELPTKV